MSKENSKLFSDKEARNDIGKQYDSYYEGGSKSIYASQYDNQVLPRDRWVLRDAALKLAKNKYPEFFGSVLEGFTGVGLVSSNKGQVRILDHGCGDGRYFSVLEEISGELNKKGIAVEVIAYDPSKVGLETYRDRLLGSGFVQTSVNTPFHTTHDIPEKGALGYRAAELERDNLKIKFIHSDVEDTTRHTKSLIGDVDMTMCMFGVLSHIPGRANRQATLRMFSEITNPDGAVVMSLPGPWRFQKEQQAYSLLRAQKSPHLLATEPGDIYYAKFQGQDRKALNFYHVYNTKEFLEDLEAGGLSPRGGVQNNYIMDIHSLTRPTYYSQALAKIDEYVSWLTPQRWVDSVSSYQIANARPRQESRVSEGFVSNVLTGERQGSKDRGRL